MSWSLAKRSGFSKFGEYSCEISKENQLFTGVHIDVSKNFIIDGKRVRVSKI